MTRLKGCIITAALALALGACAKDAPDTTGFAQYDSLEVAAPYEATWQATKTVLRERDLDIFTRDKQGVFVAFTETEGRIFKPRRTKFTVFLNEDGGRTQITVETVRQVYGVTLLTYPDWHDRKAEDNSEALAILAAIHSKVAV